MKSESALLDPSGPVPSSRSVEAKDLARKVAAVMDKADHFYLAPLSWQEYQAILDALEPGRKLRHTYDRGRLELMTRSWQHERPKMLWAYLVFILAEELELPLEPGGELTLQREDMDRGLEPDQCFWIQNADRVRGKKELNFQVDPPPDLFLEIEVSRTLLDRLTLLAVLGVPEVWRVNDLGVAAGILQQDGQYSWGTASGVFRGLDLSQVVAFLKDKGPMDRMELLRSFRKWVKEQREKGQL